jgi:hypothetical protein
MDRIELIDEDMPIWTSEALNEDMHVYSNNGETRTSYMIVSLEGQLTVEQAQTHISQMFPTERCNHSYDCCGRYYCREGKVLDVVHEDDDWTAVLVKRVAEQNV